MGLERKYVYATVVLGYYTFIFVFGFASNILIFTSSVAVGAISYVFFLVSSRYMLMLNDLKDLAVNIGIYTFISFLVIFVDWQVTLSVYKSYNAIKLLLALPSVFIWVGIWTDYYIQRVNGRV